jgi:hypothetical protein
MGLDGSRTDPEFHTDLLVRTTVRYQNEDVAFTGGQLLKAALLLFLFEFAPDGSAQPACYRGTEELRAFMNRPYRITQLSRTGILEHVSLCAGTDGLQHILALIVHAQDQNPHVRQALRNASGHLQPGLTRHGYVEDYDVWDVRLRQDERLRATGGLRNYFEAGRF